VNYRIDRLSIRITGDAGLLGAALNFNQHDDHLPRPPRLGTVWIEPFLAGLIYDARFPSSPNAAAKLPCRYFVPPVVNN